MEVWFPALVIINQFFMSEFKCLLKWKRLPYFIFPVFPSVSELVTHRYRRQKYWDSFPFISQLLLRLACMCVCVCLGVRAVCVFAYACVYPSVHLHSTRHVLSICQCGGRYLIKRPSLLVLITCAVGHPLTHDDTSCNRQQKTVHAACLQELFSANYSYSAHKKKPKMASIYH